ncbi:hypothetical protein ABZP36_009474 [Zizania latifolia]
MAAGWLLHLKTQPRQRRRPPSRHSTGPSFFLSLAQTLSAAAAAEDEAEMIYDVNSPLFRSFLSQKGGASSDKRKMEEQKPKEQKPKANENKPVMNE